MKSIQAITALVGLVATAQATHAAVLDFEDPASIQGTFLLQSYGDTANVDISYHSYDPMQGVLPDSQSMVVWTTGGYGDLNSTVAYANGPGLGFEIAFAPAPGFQVSLVSFDLGAYNRPSEEVTIHLVDFAPGVINPAVNIAATVLGNTAHSHYDVNYTTSGVLWLHVSPGYYAAIDNVVFNVTAVPEPTGATALLTGGSLLALRRRRS